MMYPIMFFIPSPLAGVGKILSIIDNGNLSNDIIMIITRILPTAMTHSKSTQNRRMFSGGHRQINKRITSAISLLVTHHRSSLSFNQRLCFRIRSVFLSAGTCSVISAFIIQQPGNQRLQKSLIECSILFDYKSWSHSNIGLCALFMSAPSLRIHFKYRYISSI